MKIDPYFSDFIKTRYRYDKELRKTARKLLLTESREALLVQPGFEESEYLESNMRGSVKSCVRGKDTAIQVYKDLCDYLKSQGVDVHVQFPPVPVDNTFERLMFLAKYLQDPETKISELPDLLWVSERTIEADLQRLRGLNDPIQICGKPFVVEDVERSAGHVRFASTAHPIFLTENLTQILIMLKGLKKMAADPLYRRYAEASAADIWEQLSDYAQNRIRFVLENLMAEDLAWYDSLARKVEQRRAYMTEREASVSRNVILDCLKNGKPFCMEYMEEDGPVIYEECFILSLQGHVAEIRTGGELKRIDLDRLLRSSYTPEELADY